MNKLFTSVLGLLTATASGLSLSAGEQAPRLVIGIHIDQLDANYLEWFKSGFGENGFRKILKNGVQIKNLTYSSEKPDHAAACAAIQTGGSPRENGITGSNWFDPETQKRISCIFDSRYLGNYTQSTFSPLNLQGSTLGDELKNASGNDARVFAIGIDPVQTILLGGHLADGAFWADDATGKWCTSTFYNYMPAWLEGINDREDIKSQAGQTTWTPLKALSNYQNIPHQNKPGLFEYAFNKAGLSTIRQFKQSPLINTSVLRLAGELLKREKLGKDAITDYLVIQLSAATNLPDRQVSGMQIQDTYYRLDEEIGKLLESVESVAGSEFCIYITGDGQTQLPAVDVPKDKNYTGDFYPQRCTSLLNLYLMAIYGNEQWVLAWDRQQLFLNRRKIEEKGINPTEIRRKAAAFLAEFSGITAVYTYDQLLLETTNENTKQKALGIRPERAADLYAELQGGWNVRETYDGHDYQVNNAFFSVPFILYRPQQKSVTITAPTGVGDITASLSRIFRIRPPNACRGVALPELEQAFLEK
jgi:hypothetical protein